MTDPRLDNSRQIRARRGSEIVAKSWLTEAAVRMLQNNLDDEVDEAHGWEPHYEQHLWLFRGNPNGVYSPFNPAVTCRHHQAAAKPAPHAAH